MWQTLLQSWLKQQVRSRAQEALAEAARLATQPADRASPEPRGPCDLGLVFALSIEAGGLVDLLSNQVVTQTAACVVRQGTLASRRIAIIETGVGRDRARRGAQTLLAGHHPAFVISAGFAGGLHADLKRGDILLVDNVVDPANQILPIDLKIDPASARATAGLHVGRLLTADAVARLPEEKQRLGQAHAALAIDMETWAVGDACRQARVPFLAVRVISDALGDELPRDVEHLARQTTTARRLGAAAAAIFRRPSSIKDMLDLKTEAISASDRLARFLAKMLEQFPQAVAEPAAILDDNANQPTAASEEPKLT